MVCSSLSFAPGPSLYPGMDITPKQFSSFLVELKKLNGHLAKLCQKQVHSVTPAVKGNEDNRNIQPVWLEPILSKYRQPETERKTEADRCASIDNSARWASWFTFAATILAFGAAAYYAHWARLTFEQIQTQTPEIQKSAEAAFSAATTASGQLELANAQFRADQRPYIALPAQITTGAVGIHEGRVRVLMPLQNFGKSPGLNATFRQHRYWN
jgi:hypothetical protein